MRRETDGAMNGSIREVIRISLPTMLSALSSNLMYFIDRSILAGYSIDAMYGAVVAGNFLSVITWTFVGIANTSEVFVGQYNGQKNFDKLAVPVWQMIYMALMTTVVFVPIGYFSDTLNILPAHALAEGVAYQRPLLYFGFLQVLNAALMAYFLGQGKTKVVVWTVVCVNAFNAILSYYCVHNLHLGAFGVAAASVIAGGLETIALFLIFISKKNRQNFNTLKSWRFNKKIFFDCVKVGLPMSLNNFSVILAWAVIASVAGYASRELGIIWGIGVNIFVLTIFVAEGLCTAAKVMVSNMIGAQDIESIKRVFKKFLAIVAIMICVFAIPMVIFPDMSFSVLNILDKDIIGMREHLETVLCLSLCVTALESVECVIWGVLTAGGDTRYPSVTSQACIWGLIVAPVCVMYHTGRLEGPESVVAMYFFMLFSYAVGTALMYRRYLSLKWFRAIV